MLKIILHISLPLIVILMWIGSGFYIHHNYPPTERGVVGDMFGAINALFSGLAFLGVIYAILMQSKELELQRIEIKNSVEAQSKTANTLEMQTKLNLHSIEMSSLNNMIAYYSEEIDALLRDKPLSPDQNALLHQMRTEKNNYAVKLKQAFKNYMSTNGLNNG